MRPAAAIAILALAVPAIPPAATIAEARLCGGPLPCRCGDTLRGISVTLDADFGPCAGVGLRLTTDAALDCAGHTIAGLGPEQSTYGVKLDSVTGAQVRNCLITGFERGVRIRAGQDSIISGNVLIENEYGIDVAGATSAGMAVGHRIVDNVVRDSILDGIHLGWGTHESVVRGNTITGSGEESLYVLYNEHALVADNTISGGGAAAIYVKHSEHNAFIGNRVSDRPIQVRGESIGNVFAHTVIEGAGFAFEAHEDGFPHDNIVFGGAVIERHLCFRFAGAFDQHVSGVLVGHCTPAVMETAAGQAATGNVVAVTPITEDFDADGIANAEDTCTDTDGDGVGDPGFAASDCGIDRCRTVPDAGQTDTDGDGTGDACDLCPVLFDPAQRDADGDGIGDACNSCVGVTDGSACDDGSICTLEDVCQDSACVGGALRSCDDGDVCTDDACDPIEGCVHTPNDAPCDDGNACTVMDRCHDGQCMPGAPFVCPAPPADGCNRPGQCDPASGVCLYLAKLHGSSCDDGNVCTIDDACEAGACTAGTPRDCSDGDLCTADLCEPATGCRHVPTTLDAVQAAFPVSLRTGACLVEPFPRRIERAVRRAARILDRVGKSAPGASGRKASRRILRALRLLEKAARIAGRTIQKEPSRTCAARLLQSITDLHVRTLCLAADRAL